jgi:hypothetical protein
MFSMSIFLRTFFTIVLFFSALFFPWWVTLAAGLFGIILFAWYFEALFIGLFIDILYADAAMVSFVEFPYFFTLIFVIGLGFFAIIKKRLISF